LDSLVYPERDKEFKPKPDMPETVSQDFVEAARIVNRSPRGAAALLRLCIQKLCRRLGESGTDINSDIGRLVKKGLDPHVQKAMDVVRVIGNEAVHPGQIDLRDDHTVAHTLFALVNKVVKTLITRPREIDEIYGKLPKGKLEQIGRRDQTK
jgi:hypothetical protein